MISLKLRARVVAGRLVLEVGDGPPVIVCRVITCPCCSTKFVPEVPCLR